MKIVKRLLHLWITLSTGALLCWAPAAKAQTTIELPTLQLYAGMHRLSVEVAAQTDARTRGLMWRKSLPTNHGMLFIFPQKATQCFWMKNTLIPLSIAFLQDDGTVVNMEDMQPLTIDGHCSKAPVRYALEVNQGWFKQRNVTESQRIRGLPQLP